MAQTFSALQTAQLTTALADMHSRMSRIAGLVDSHRQELAMSWTGDDMESPANLFQKSLHDWLENHSQLVGSLNDLGDVLTKYMTTNLQAQANLASAVGSWSTGTSTV